jgi:endoglucanase
MIVSVAAAGCGSGGLAVHVDGNRLVDGRGHPIRLLGVNRSGAEYGCIQGLGLFVGPTDRRAIAAMAAWRINAVRVPLNEDCWLGINGAPAAYSGMNYRRALRDYVGRLHAAGLYVILDLHWNAPGSTPATAQQPMADLDHAPAFWSSVAREFATDPAVVFDLYNEPQDISWSCWRDGCMVPEGWRAAGMQTLVDAVRSTGARQPVIASGLNYASDLSSWLTYRPRDPAGQLVAGFHVFDFAPCSRSRCWEATLVPVAQRVPVVTGEVGQRACSSPFIGRYMRWADRVQVSYLGWSWNPVGCESPALISAWDGTPTASGARLRAHLARLAAG